MKKTYKRGFTLIELLVVIAIIGILSSIVLASLNSARQKGRDARRLADVKQLQLALELYYDSNSAYPATLSTAALVTPGYISVIPTDPTNQAAYSYAGLSTSVGGTCSSYHIGGSLETAGHSALSSDADTAVTTNICSGSAADFPGVDTGACATGDAGVACFDLKP
ncbi:prepilin-type N-terminal cleavage/methylation domain-containing protein [Candidatus Kaiserbacteria bacterium]|nr:prepilin-type N-terminal cleavage/methylation domain-containing protein [Candidatus Kaiserbacteria bacterium]